MVRRGIVVLWLAGIVLVPALRAFAADQTFVISAPLKACTVPFAGVSPPSAAEAAQLISGNQLDVVASGQVAHLIHVATYNADSSIQEQRWFVYDGKAVSDAERIFGRRTVHVIYVHRNVPSASRDAVEKSLASEMPTIVRAAADKVAEAQADVDDADKAMPRDAAEVRQRTRVLQEAQKTLAALQAAGFADRSLTALFAGSDTAVPGVTFVTREGTATVRLADRVIPEAFDLLRTLAYTVEATKREPAPLEHLGQLVDVAGQAQAGGAKAAVDLTPSDFCSAGTVTIRDLPSDLNVTAVVKDGGKDKALGSVSILDEKKYFYDFGFALPVVSYNDLTVGAADHTLTSTQLKKDALFAVVMLTNPQDLEKPGLRVGGLYGMPLSGRAVKHHLGALALGWGPVQVFAGYVANRLQVAPGVATAASAANAAQTDETTTVGEAADVKAVWRKSFTWGVVFSTDAIVKFLARKK